MRCDNNLTPEDAGHLMTILTRLEYSAPEGDKVYDIAEFYEMVKLVREYWHKEASEFGPAPKYLDIDSSPIRMVIMQEMFTRERFALTLGGFEAREGPNQFIGELETFQYFNKFDIIHHYAHFPNGETAKRNLEFIVGKSRFGTILMLPGYSTEDIAMVPSVVRIDPHFAIYRKVRQQL